MLTEAQIAELADVDGRQRREVMTLLLQQANAREELQARHQAERETIARRLGVPLQGAPNTTAGSTALERAAAPGRTRLEVARPGRASGGGG